MDSAIKWGIILALAVSLFSAIWVLAGMHTSLPAAMGYLGVVILLNIVAVILALRESASRNGYGGQLASGLVLGMVGGGVIFLTSFIMLSFVFPGAIPDQVAAFKTTYAAMPVTEDQKQILIDSLATVTPVSSAFQGAVGTLFTSVIAGAITGAFLRKK